MKAGGGASAPTGHLPTWFRPKGAERIRLSSNFKEGKRYLNSYLLISKKVQEPQEKTGYIFTQ